MSTRKTNVLARLAVLFVLLCSTWDATGQHRDNVVYNRIVQVKGKVTIVNHPTLGKTNGSGVYLVFQRDGCTDCLVATRTDANGNYEIFVGLGRYKLIVRERSRTRERIDYLPPDQPRYVTASNIVDGETFDIRIVLPE